MDKITFISLTKKIGRSLVVSIPRDIAEKENIDDNEFLEIISIKKL